MTAIARVAARVLPVNERGEVLLLQGQDPARPGDLHWVSVGGAVEPGESLVAAAVRELFEETGVVAAEEDLLGPIHRGSNAFSWGGADYVNDSTFFALALDSTADIHFDGLEHAEVGNLFQAAWWTPEALRIDGRGTSVDLPDIMTAAIAAVRGAQ